MKKIYNCCHSIVAVCRYWQIIFGQKLVSKIEKPAKIRFEIRETRNELMHVEKQAKAKLIYKLNIARSLARLFIGSKLSSLGIV